MTIAFRTGEAGGDVGAPRPLVPAVVATGVSRATVGAVLAVQLLVPGGGARRRGSRSSRACS